MTHAIGLQAFSRIIADHLFEFWVVKQLNMVKPHDPVLPGPNFHPGLVLVRPWKKDWRWSWSSSTWPAGQSTSASRCHPGRCKMPPNEIKITNALSEYKLVYGNMKLLSDLRCISLSAFVAQVAVSASMISCRLASICSCHQSSMD